MTDTSKLSLEQIRLRLLENGYTPLPGVGKACYMKGWPTVAVTPELINGPWRRKGNQWPDTCIRIENGLAAIDLDIDDNEATMLAIVAEIDAEVPGLSQRAMVRFGKGTKEAWYVRTSEIFGRIHGAGYCPPGKTPDQLTCRVEIFGGGSPREFGSIGAHTRAADGSVVVAYEWQGASPLDTRLDDLPELTKQEFYAIVAAVERVLLRLGWTLVARSKAGEDNVERLFALTDDMQFVLHDGRRLSLPDVRKAAADEDGLRCSASWLEGDIAVNTSRCLIGLTKGGHVAIYETASGIAYIEKSAAPAPKPKLNLDRVAEKLTELKARRMYTIHGDDDAEVAAKKMLHTYAYCATARNCVIPIREPDGAMTLIAFRSLYAANITDSLPGPRGGITKVSPVDLWLTHTQRVTVAGTRMRPDREWPLYEDEGAQWVNTYRAPHHPQEGGDAGPGMDFLARLVPEPSERRWFLQWLSYKLQYPFVPGPAVILVSPSFGTGRGMLAELLAALFGRRYVKSIPFHMVSGKSYQSQYNDWGATALVAFVSESSETEGSTSTYQARQNAYEHLKALVEPRATMRMFVRKGEPNYEAMSFASLFVATNHRDAIPLPPNDRRFGVLTNDLPPQPQEYWEGLQLWMEDPLNVGAFYRELVAVDLAGYSPFVAPPVTAGKLAMADAALSDLDRAYAAAMDALGDVFVPDQVIKAMRAAAADQGLDMPDRWQVTAKRIIRNTAARVGVPHGRNWTPMIDGHRYPIYAKTSALAKLWTDAEPSHLRDAIMKNGSPSAGSLDNVVAFRRLNHGDDQ